MSRRAARIVFGLLVVIVGSFFLGAVFLSPAPPILSTSMRWLGALCEIAVLVVGGAIACTAPSHALTPLEVLVPSPAPSIYRGPRPPPKIDPIAKTSAKRVTLAVLASLAFTGAAVPFALHQPRWIEGEMVLAAWWTIWSVMIGVLAYRGTPIDDDHRRGGAAVDLSAPVKVTAKLGDVLSGVGDLEGCVVALAIIVTVGVAMFGAWLVVELVAPAVFIVAYRGVVRGLARARAANAKSNAPRSALVGMGWALAYTAPLAAVVAVAHALFDASR